MADTLRIKRRAAGGAAGAPASLAAAEIAYNEVDDTLYYGKGNSGGAATSIVPIAGPGAFQPLDADLTAIAALAGTNTIYYRSAANTWAAVNVSTGLSFSGGNLTASGGGGDVFKAGANTFTAQNCFTNAGVVVGHTAAISASGLELHGIAAAGSGNYIVATRWSNENAGQIFSFQKSRGTTPGSHVVVQSSDGLGIISFLGSDGTNFRTAATIQVIANGAPAAGVVPGAIGLYATNAAGTLVQCGSISPAVCNFIGDVAGSGGAPTGYIGEYLTASASSVALTSGAYTATASLSLPPGDWDVRGVVRVTGPAGSYMYCNVYTASASTSGSADSTQTGIFTGLGDCWTAVGPFRVSRSSTATYYLNIYVATAGCTAVTSEIQARRRH